MIGHSQIQATLHVCTIYSLYYINEVNLNGYTKVLVTTKLSKTIVSE